MIDIRILGIGDELALESFLLPRVDSSMFLIGNMRAAGLVDKGGDYRIVLLHEPLTVLQ